MSQCFPKPLVSHFGDSIKDLSNYATKTNTKNISDVDTSSFALKIILTKLSSLKAEVDKLDINKLIPISVDYCKLSDVVKSDVVKKNCI